MLGDADDGALGGHVGRTAAAVHAGHGRHVDDGCARLQMGENGTDALHGAHLIDCDDLGGLSVIELVHGGQAGVQHAGVVHQHINAAEFLQRHLCQMLAVLVLGNVRGNGDHAAAGLGDFGGHIVQRGLTAGADDDVGAILGKGHGGGSANAGVAAGDDNGLIGKFSHGNQPPHIIVKIITYYRRDGNS